MSIETLLSSHSKQGARSLKRNYRGIQNRAASHL